MVRMSRQVVPETRLFVREPLALAPLAHDRERMAGRGAAGVVAEQRHLGRRALGALGVIHRWPHRRDQARPARVDRVERTGANERLDGAPVHRALVDAAAELEQILERSAGAARRGDRLDRRLPGALDAAQSVADAGRVYRLEAVVRGVDVRRQHGESHRDGVVAEVAHLVGIVHDHRQIGREKRRRVVRLQIRGLRRR